MHMRATSEHDASAAGFLLVLMCPTLAACAAAAPSLALALGLGVSLTALVTLAASGTVFWLLHRRLVALHRLCAASTVGCMDVRA
jgi:hypothetical protein